MSAGPHENGDGDVDEAAAGRGEVGGVRRTDSVSAAEGRDAASAVVRSGYEVAACTRSAEDILAHSRVVPGQTSPSLLPNGVAAARLTSHRALPHANLHAVPPPDDLVVAERRSPRSGRLVLRCRHLDDNGDAHGVAGSNAAVGVVVPSRRGYGTGCWGGYGVQPPASKACAGVAEAPARCLRWRYWRWWRRGGGLFCVLWGWSE